MTMLDFGMEEMTHPCAGAITVLGTPVLTAYGFTAKNDLLCAEPASRRED